MPSSLKRILVGSPKATAQAPHERLGNLTALAVFSSDALSSVAYATEETLLILFSAGAAGLRWSFPTALWIGLLLIVLTVSYRQTIHAYPSGGGAYIVAKENLGTHAGLVAAAALLIDYVLTASVSVAAGVAAITSALPGLYRYRVELCLIGVALVTIANLRGVRESGRIFAVPTYFFIFSLLIMMGAGIAKLFFGAPMPTGGPEPTAVTGIGVFLILRAFAAGCTALTGVEAISNGVPAFRPPAAANAALTMSWMASILLVLFLGITALAHQYGILPREGETVVSQLARTILGQGMGYYAVQAATALILILAANTSFADFPRLASLLARDGFLPRQLASRGDRLVFSNGILALGVSSSLLLVLFRGQTHSIIPLYAVGVFLSFTLSQAGMVQHWRTSDVAGRRRSALINGMGAATTGLVLWIIASTKFLHGAWIVVLAIPALMWGFEKIHHHYRLLREQLRLKHYQVAEKITNRVLVLVPDIHMGVVKALTYARTVSPHVEAVHVEQDSAVAEELRLKWVFWGSGVPLVVLESPYRSILAPLRAHMDRIQGDDEDAFVTLVIPEFIPARRWQHLLHNQTGFWIKAAFLFRPRTVVVSVPYHLKE